jgi:hypothetical protein
MSLKQINDKKAGPYREECDWCGDEACCYSVAKSDGMPGDMCASCVVKNKVYVDKKR